MPRHGQKKYKEWFILQGKGGNMDVVTSTYRESVHRVMMNKNKAFLSTQNFNEPYSHFSCCSKVIPRLKRNAKLN